MNTPANTIHDDGSLYLSRITRAAFAVIAVVAVAAGVCGCTATDKTVPAMAALQSDLARMPPLTKSATGEAGRIAVLAEQEKAEKIAEWRKANAR
ncbi:MAG TPA: hypothetical protein VF595_16065 [Tepidisphaeraceae bacterium]|jgi:hypothetical protein